MMRRSLVALLICSTVACGRSSNIYHAFVASHDAIRPGMSVRQVFELGLADYLIRSDGKNVPGSTLPAKTPVSSECSRYVVDIHCGGGAFVVRVYCDMNGPSDKQLAQPGSFPTTVDFIDGLARYEPWLKEMSFRVESPALKIGGVYDSYEFAIDGGGKVTLVSAIRLAAF